MVPCRTFFDSSLFLGRVAAEDLLNNFVDLLVVFFRAGVRVDLAARHAAPHHRTGTPVCEINHKHAHIVICRCPLISELSDFAGRKAECEAFSGVK